MSRDSHRSSDLPPRTTLVTGGAGFLGRCLTSLLVERGERVRVLDVTEPPEPVGDVDYIVGSVTDRAAVDAALRGVSRVYHLAGIPDLWAADRGEFARVNHLGTQTVCAAALAAGVERLVYTSTALIAGGRPEEPLELIDGGGARGAARRAPGPYCRSKRLAEQAVAGMIRRGLRAVVVRPAALVGPGDQRLTPPTRLLLNLLNGRIPVMLETTLNLIDVRDAALGSLEIAERGEPGRAYALGGAEVLLSELLTLLRGLTGLDMPRGRVPYWLALAGSAAEEWLARLGLRGAPLSSVEGVRLARRPPTVDGESIRRRFGLTLRPLRETIADAIRDFAERGLLIPRAARAVEMRLDDAGTESAVGELLASD